MSTSCSIALKNKDNTYRAIYCEFDGHPRDNGKKLVSYYKTEEKIKALLNIGNLWELGEEPVEEEWSYGGRKSRGFPMCRSYRTIGERDTDAKSFENQESVLDYYTWVDYNYFFEDEEWYCIENGSQNKKRVKDIFKYVDGRAKQKFCEMPKGQIFTDCIDNSFYSKIYIKIDKITGGANAVEVFSGNLLCFDDKTELISLDVEIANIIKGD